MRAFLLVSLFAAPLTLGACGRGAKPVRSQPLMEVFRRNAQDEPLTRTQTDGKRLFAHYCVTCHGDAGQGDGQNAYNLQPSPPDFRESLGSHPSSYWREIIEGGSAAVGRSPLCPPWGRTLSAEEVEALIAYLETLKRPESAEATAPPRPGPPS